jgi:hypothetical protein
MSGVEGWIEWHGGENPVPGQAVNLRQIAYKNDDGYAWESDAQDWKRSKQGEAGDIIAYRVVTPAVSGVEGLKPCPFCGGNAFSQRAGSWQTSCTECHAGTPMSYALREFSEEAWNRRAPVEASAPTEQADGGVVALDELLRRSVEAFKTLPPEERRRMIAAQRESYVRGMTTPCEHGVLDFEQCGDCRSSTPPATPIAGGFGSSPDGDTQPGSADRWAELERLAKAAAKRAPGLWGSDIEKSDGSYGSGDDDRTGFMVPYMETEHGKRLFDAHYCDVAEIHEDYDSDEHGSHLYAWDEAAREIFAFLAAVQPSAILELIAAARRDEGAGQ